MLKDTETDHVGQELVSNLKIQLCKEANGIWKAGNFIFSKRVNTGVKISTLTSLLEWRKRGFGGTVRSRNQSSKRIHGSRSLYTKSLE